MTISLPSQEIVIVSPCDTDTISCGTGMTKAFLEAGKNSGLDLKAVITVNKELLDKDETNNDHTGPCSKNARWSIPYY